MNNEEEVTIVTEWDSMPPEVFSGATVYSTRVLAMKYRKMERALTDIHNRISAGDLDEWSIKALDEIAKESLE